MSVTGVVVKCSGWLNATALLNMAPMSSTLDVFRGGSNGGGGGGVGSTVSLS